MAADKSTRHLRKRFRWWFLNRQRLSFHWLILSQQGLWPLMNQRVTCASSFVDDFWVGRNSVFLDFFWVDRGCKRWQIHASPLEGFSVMISKAAATKFSMTISESTGAMCAEQSTYHLWKRFRWWFMSWQWLSSRCLFLCCCDVAVAQINYPSFKHNTQGSMEQARGRSHEEVSSQIFMLYVM